MRPLFPDAIIDTISSASLAEQKSSAIQRSSTREIAAPEQESADIKLGQAERV